MLKPRSAPFANVTSFDAHVENVMANLSSRLVNTGKLGEEKKRGSSDRREESEGEEGTTKRIMRKGRRRERESAKGVSPGEGQR